MSNMPLGNQLARTEGVQDDVDDVHDGGGDDDDGDDDETMMMMTVVITQRTTKPRNTLAEGVQ